MHDACMGAQVAESEAVLACRLIARKTEPLDKMITRVQTARQEMRHLRSFDYGDPRALLTVFVEILQVLEPERGLAWLAVQLHGWPRVFMLHCRATIACNGK